MSLERFYGLMPPPIVFVDMDRVVLDDLLAADPGRIVRCYGDPNLAVKWVQPESSEALGCIGGFISDEEEKA